MNKPIFHMFFMLVVSLAESHSFYNDKSNYYFFFIYQEVLKSTSTILFIELDFGFLHSGGWLWNETYWQSGFSDFQCGNCSIFSLHTWRWVWCIWDVNSEATSKKQRSCILNVHYIWVKSKSSKGDFPKTWMLQSMKHCVWWCCV